MEFTVEKLENSKLYEFTKYFAKAALLKLNKLDGKPEVSKVFKIVGALGGLTATVATKLPIGGAVSTVLEEGPLLYSTTKQKNDKIQLNSVINSFSSKHSRADFLRCVTRLGVSVYNEYKDTIVYVNQQSSNVEDKKNGTQPDKTGTIFPAAVVRKENKNQAMHALGKYVGEMVFDKMLKLGMESHETIVASFTEKSIMDKIEARCDTISALKLFYWSQKPGKEFKEKTLTPYNYFVEKGLDEPVKSRVAIRTRHEDVEKLDVVHQSWVGEKCDLISVADAIYEMIIRDPSFDWEMSVTQGITDIKDDLHAAGNDIKSELIEVKEKIVNIPAQVVSLIKSESKLDSIWFPLDAFQHLTVHGRENFVADLHNDITNIKGKICFVIHGFGGIGKTTVVRKYINDYSKNYDHIIWIHAQDVPAAQSQFRLLAAKKLGFQLDTDLNSPKDFKELLEKIYETLCRNQARVLLVLDNAEAVSVNDAENTCEVESLKSLLPPSCPGFDIKVLITSRECNWNDDFHSIKLGHWTDKECIDYVLEKLKLDPTPENKKTALALAKHFNHLTISIKSAVSFIREEKDSQQHEGEVSYGIQDLLNDYDKGTKGRNPEIKLWNNSFEIILKRENGELAIKIICFMAFFVPGPIPKHFLRALFQDMYNEDCITAAIRLLTSYSLIDFFGTYYTIHRNIQEAVIQNLKLDSGSKKSLVFTVATFADDTQVLRQLTKQLHVHLSQMTTKEALAEKNFNVITNSLHVTSFLSKKLFLFPECREFTEAVADIMDNSRNLNKAVELYQNVFESINQETENGSAQALAITDKIGGVLNQQGKFEDALEISSEMLKVKLNVFGAYHPSTLATQTNVIESLVKLKRHDEASEMFNKFQEDIKEMTHPQHPSALIAKLNFASLLYQHLENYVAALPVFQNVLEELSKSSKPNQKDILSVQNWIASTFLKLGRHDDANDIHKAIIGTSIDEFGPSSMLTLFYRKQYAYALDKQGDPKKALEVWNDILKSGEESGEESQFVNQEKFDIPCNVANLYIQLKEFDKAIKILTSLVDSFGDEHDPDHHLKLLAMHNLAFAFEKNGKKEDSLKLYEQVLESRHKTLGLCHPQTLITKRNIGYAYFNKNDYEKALVIADEILSTKDKSVGGKHTFDYSCTETLRLRALLGYRSEKVKKLTYNLPF